jgi:hypothetical protein
MGRPRRQASCKYSRVSSARLMLLVLYGLGEFSAPTHPPIMTI